VAASVSKTRPKSPTTAARPITRAKILEADSKTPSRSLLWSKASSP
jgi:hypothetical protein